MLTPKAMPTIAPVLNLPDDGVREVLYEPFTPGYVFPRDPTGVAVT